MLSEMIQFALAHPLAVLVGAGLLAAGWLIAAFISVMPPLPDSASWGKRWAYACAQIFGASLDKAGHAAAQTQIFKQVEHTLTTDGLTKLETAKTTTQTAEPVMETAASPK